MMLSSHISRLLGLSRAAEARNYISPALFFCCLQSMTLEASTKIRATVSTMQPATAACRPGSTAFRESVAAAARVRKETGCNLHHADLAIVCTCMLCCRQRCSFCAIHCQKNEWKWKKITEFQQPFLKRV